MKEARDAIGNPIVAEKRNKVGTENLRRLPPGILDFIEVSRSRVAASQPNGRLHTSESALRQHILT